MAVDENYNPIKLFVIKSEDLDKFPKSAIRQFKNVQKAFTVFPDNKSINKLNNQDYKEYFKKCHELVNSGVVKELKETNKLFQELNK